MSRAGQITEAGLSDLVGRFYARAREDDMLGPVFSAAIQDWPPHIQRITDFWSSVMLKSGRYDGNPLARHRDHGLQPEMFERWLNLWGQTVDEGFESPASDQLKARAEMIGQSLSIGLFFKLEPKPGGAAP